MPHVYTIDGPLGLAGNQAALAYSGRPGVVFNAEGQISKPSGWWLVGGFWGGVATAFAVSATADDAFEGGQMIAAGVAATIVTAVISGVGFIMARKSA